MAKITIWQWYDDINLKSNQNNWQFKKNETYNYIIKYSVWSLYKRMKLLGLEETVESKSKQLRLGINETKKNTS